MVKNEKIIYVYDSFTFDEPMLLGKLYVGNQIALMHLLCKRDFCNFKIQKLSNVE